MATVRGREAVYEAAEAFRSRCLIADGSLFFDGELWTGKNLATLQRVFVNAPDEGDRTFLEKLRDQVSGAGQPAVRLVAEALAVYFLFSGSVGGEKKRETINAVLAWSGDALSPDHEVARAFDEGIGSTGQGYNTRRPYELWFLIDVATRVKAKTQVERESVFATAITFRTFVDAVPDAGKRQLRHILLHLFYPAQFEATSSTSQKKEMVKAFGHLVPNAPADADETLALVRSALEAKYPNQEVSFYRSPIRELWLDKDDDTETPDDITREDVLAAISDLQRGTVDHEFGPSTTYDLLYEGKRYPPKAVYGIAARRTAGRVLNPREFSGGEESKCFAMLRSLGFEVVPKAGGMTTLSSSLPAEARAWIEISSNADDHGGEAGWRLGEALWSPTKNRSGADFYALMREPKPGDVVIHLISDDDDDENANKQLIGVSVVASRAEEAPTEPAKAGRWTGMAPYYRVRLEQFRRFPTKIPIGVLFKAHGDVVRKHIDADTKHYPFITYDGALRIAQGRYLATCPSELLDAVEDVVAKTRRVFAIYVGRGAARNFELARDASTWGADEEAKFKDIQDGDGLLFVHDITSLSSPAPAGYPRVKSADHFAGRARLVLYGRVTKAPYKSEETIWPNGVYPARFLFEELKEDTNVQVSVAEFPEVLIDAVRRSATSEGRPRLACVYNFGPWSGPMTPPKSIAKADPAAIAASFSDALLQSGFHIGQHHEHVARAFISSLLSKPFVILTGLSGSGKTQIGIKLGQWLGPDRWRLIPVRPDWTGPEFLLGYEDALRKPRADGARPWVVPTALEFMLTAAADPERPYLLILDEMNLAHVERYFADVLSGMESRDGFVLPNLIRDKDGWYPKSGAPGRVGMPRNLFIIGTVNVDETTYLFSPKVLDRASTLEFRVPTEALPIADSVARPATCKPGDPSLVAGFVSVATDDAWHLRNAPSDMGAVSTHLRALHAALLEHNCEFGHRTFYEGMRLAALLHASGTTTLEDRLDVFVLQKVLPRLHGARRKLEPVLKSLARFCHDLEKPAPGKELDVDSLPADGARLPRSQRKVRRMLVALRANQFASFSD